MQIIFLGTYEEEVKTTTKFAIYYLNLNGQHAHIQYILRDLKAIFVFVSQKQRIVQRSMSITHQITRIPGSDTSFHIHGWNWFPLRSAIYHIPVDGPYVRQLGTLQSSVSVRCTGILRSTILLHETDLDLLVWWSVVVVGGVWREDVDIDGLLDCLALAWGKDVVAVTLLEFSSGNP